MDRTRVLVTIASLALLGATLEPALRDPDDDGFPFSTYPMFASKRPTEQTYLYAVGETATGGRRTLDPGLVGTGEVLQALQVFDRAYAGGPRELAALCDTIAERVASDGDFADVAAIRIVTGSHDAVEYLTRGHIGHERDRVRCLVRRNVR